MEPVEEKAPGRGATTGTRLDDIVIHNNTNVNDEDIPFNDPGKPLSQLNDEEWKALYRQETGKVSGTTDSPYPDITVEDDTSPDDEQFPYEKLLPAAGLIRSVHDFIVSTTERPNRPLALAGAVSLIAAMAGRRYRTESGLLSNLYILQIAGTGVGKEAPRAAIKNLLSDIGAMEILGGDNIMSDSGLISAMETYPVKLFLLDEFGKVLQAINAPKGASVHLAGIATVLLTLYSAAQSNHAGRQYADTARRPQIIIHNPCAVLSGSTTPSTLYEALSSKDVLSGLLGRMVVVDGGEKRPHRETPRKVDTEQLVARLKAFYELNNDGGNLSTLQAAELKPNLYTVKETAGARQLRLESDDQLDAITGEIERSLYNRLIENASKLALVYAVAKSPGVPVIDEQAFMWGLQFSEWSVKRLITIAKRHVSEGSYHSLTLRVEKLIEQAGEKGLKVHEVNRSIRDVQPKQTNAVIDHLAGSGFIVPVKNGIRQTEVVKGCQLIHGRLYHE